MNPSNSLVTLILVAATVLSSGLACSNNEPSTTSNAPSANTGSVTNTVTNSVTAPAPSAPKSIAGNYDVTGTNVDGGGNYKASLLVTPRDDVYQFSWNSGGKSYDGVGVMTDSTVAVSYTDGQDGKGCGVVLYKIGSDGTLDGKAGYWGVNSAESEKAKRTSGSDLEGKYEVNGRNTGGNEYKGTLNIRKDGEGYVFSWNAGSTFEGFGIKTGDKVAVGFGGKQCAFVSYEMKPDGTLDGKWGGQSSKTFGSEVARKQ